MRYYQACQILGVESDASKEDAKRAYRKLANIHHPDKGGNAEKFKEIASAYRAFVSIRPIIQLVRKPHAPPPPAGTAPPPPSASAWDDISPEDLERYRHHARQYDDLEKSIYAENRQAILILLILGGLAYAVYIAVTTMRPALLWLLMPPALVLIVAGWKKSMYWLRITFNLLSAISPFKGEDAVGIIPIIVIALFLFQVFF